MNESKISLKTGLENRRVDSKYTRSILDDFRKILQLALGAVKESRQEPESISIQLEDLRPILGFNRVFEQKLSHVYIERFLFKDGNAKTTTDLAS